MNLFNEKDKGNSNDKNEKDESKSKLTGLKDNKNFFEEISKRTKNSNTKIFSFSFNPLLFIVASIIIGLVIFGVFKFAQPEGAEISVREFIQNMKQKKYSEVIIKENVEAVGVSKYVEIIPYNEEISDLLDLDKKGKQTDVVSLSGDEGNLKTLNLEDFVESLELPSIKEALKATIDKKGVNIVDKVLVGKDFAIAKILRKDGEDLYVDEIDIDSLEEQIEVQGKEIKELPVEFVYLESAATEAEFDNFEKKYENGFYSDVWILKDKIVALVQQDEITKHVVQIGSLKTDFPRFLDDQGISFDNDEVEVKSMPVPNIPFGAIFQILSMLFIGFLIFSIMKGIKGSGKSLMRFGKSKAKMFFGKKPEVTFEDVAGIDYAKEELNEIVLFLKDPKRFLKLGARIPKGLLMVGAPGTGKTLLARAIAGEAAVPFFHTSGSEFEEMLVGAGASRVRDLFAKAKKTAPALVFIDEIDAVARKRGTTIQSSSTEQTLNQILVEMDGFEKNTNVIVIAATNRPDVLDPAILRPGRFDRRIVINLPDIKGREEILKIHAKNKPLAEDADLRKVARRTVGYSGADLENMLNEAAIIVAKEGRKEIEFNDIEEAANRVVMGRERKLERTKEQVKKTAYHEAGHAIVAKITPESDPVHRITVISRGKALGTTMQLPERDKYSQSYQEMISKLRVFMAGRAAEELIYGSKKITSGAANDIKEATKLARRMVKEFGFSPKLGLVKYGESNELQYLGYGYGDMRDFSDATARLIDEEVMRFINQAYHYALETLSKNKDKLEKIAEDLVEKEVMEAEDFDKYFKE